MKKYVYSLCFLIIIAVLAPRVNGSPSYGLENNAIFSTIFNDDDAETEPHPSLAQHYDLHGYAQIDLLFLPKQIANQSELRLNGEINPGTKFIINLSGAEHRYANDNYLAVISPQKTLKVGHFDTYWEGATSPFSDAEKAALWYNFAKGSHSYDVFVGEKYRDQNPAWWSVSLTSNHDTTHLYRYLHNTVTKDNVIFHQDVMELGWSFKKEQWRFHHYVALGVHQEENFIYGINWHVSRNVGDDYFWVDIDYDDKLNYLERNLEVETEWNSYLKPWYYGIHLFWDEEYRQDTDILKKNTLEYYAYLQRYFFKERLKLTFENGATNDALYHDDGSYNKVEWRYQMNSKLDFEGLYRVESDSDIWYTYSLFDRWNPKDEILVSFSSRVLSDEEVPSTRYHRGDGVWRLKWRRYF